MTIFENVKSSSDSIVTGIFGHAKIFYVEKGEVCLFEIRFRFFFNERNKFMCNMNGNTETEAVDTLEEIYAWIDQIQFSRPKKNIARDFSDAVLMAELLKKYYPRNVDVHNYVSGSSIAKKVDNWCTLNRKVLSKLDMKLGKEEIDQLSNSQHGAIEKVLMDLRTKILKDSNADRDSLYFGYEENGKGETVRSLLNSEEVTNKTVPRRVFVRLKEELEEKNKAIENLNYKVSHLESVMKLKDQRIADLTTQIIKPQDNTAVPKVHASAKSISKYQTSKP
ncbi:sperm flagellar protein 1-like [Cephus cinctus]|uniref:Sperm flagellar protein 1-like n=1 Tax=Cephus cinctus TaxID=211228 RepID=A0AAJ7RIG6_CEPCN|nr:sperm flagellar protein 1-like [Cephus cinctus]